LKARGLVDIRERLASLEGKGVWEDTVAEDYPSPEGGAGGQDSTSDRVHETSSFGTFGLDGRPDITDAEKLRHLCEAMGKTAS